MASTSIPQKHLNDGNSIPTLGFGTGSTFKKGRDNNINPATRSSIGDALSMGITHLDTAEVYGTEPELGEAIKRCSIPRSQLFVTTKVVVHIQDIPKAIDMSLRKMGLDYVDLYLIHNPHFTTEKEDLQRAWLDMEAVRRSGKARSIGVSSFQIKHLESILEVATIVPAVNQIELHPYLQREVLRQFGHSKGIVTAAYSPLGPIRKGAPGPLDPVLKKVAEEYKVAPETILLRWVIQQDAVVITTSRQKQRVEGYLQAFGFELSRKDVEEISRVGKEKHYRNDHSLHHYPDSDKE